MVEELCQGHEALVCLARKINMHVSEVHDLSKSDLLAKSVDVHEKNAWMLRSISVRVSDNLV